eukprot:Opistho-2@34889
MNSGAVQGRLVGDRAQAATELVVAFELEGADWAEARTITRAVSEKTEASWAGAPWKTKESVELATLEWVSWFNHHRLLEPIGYIPPAEAEANYYRQLASQTTTVGV